MIQVGMDRNIVDKSLNPFYTNETTIIGNPPFGKRGKMASDNFDLHTSG